MKRLNWGLSTVVLALGISVGWTMANVGVGFARSAEFDNRGSIRQGPFGGGGNSGSTGIGGSVGGTGGGGGAGGSGGTFTGTGGTTSLR